MIKNLLVLLIALVCVQTMPAIASPDKCSGNACADLDLTDWEYHTPGTAIKSVTVQNYGNKRIKYAVWWANAFGQCNTRNEGVLQAGGSKVINNATAVYLGVCKVDANYV